MQPFDYLAIAPLIDHREQIDLQVKCVFECPTTGVRATAGAEPEQPGLLKRIAAYLKSWISDREAENELRMLTVKAFRQASDHFHWDPLAGCWIGLVSADHPGLAGPFERRLSAFPVTQPRDQRILNRMLAEVAITDRTGTAPEQEFLAALSGLESIMPLTDALPAQPLTPIELASTTAAVRPTMLMLAWAVARCDGRSKAEDVLLDRFSAALSLAGAPADGLRDAALAYLLGLRLARLDGSFSEAPEETFLRGLDAAVDLGIDPRRAEHMLALQSQLLTATQG